MFSYNLKTVRYRKREEPYECIVYLSFTANEDMNNGSSKPTQPCIPSGTHRNHNISSSPVGVSKSIHKQNKKAISHERACIGDTTTSALHASSSSCRAEARAAQLIM